MSLYDPYLDCGTKILTASTGQMHWYRLAITKFCGLKEDPTKEERGTQQGYSNDRQNIFELFPSLVTSTDWPGFSIDILHDSGFALTGSHTAGNTAGTWGTFHFCRGRHYFCARGHDLGVTK